MPRRRGPRPGEATTRAIAAIALAAALVPGVARAATTLEIQGGGCLDGAAIRARLEPLLAPFADARGGTVAVVARQGNGLTLATLRVVAVTGELVLERRFSLAREDCPSAPELIATVLDRFLRELPRERWADLPRQPAGFVVIGRDLPWVSVVARGSVAARLPQPSADLEVSLTFETGTGRRRLYGTGVLRLGQPMRLGDGRFVDGVAAMGLGWRMVGTSLVTEVELRTGARLGVGFDYTRSRWSWLPWVELHGGVQWPWRGWLIGPVLAVSPLRQRAVTVAGAESTLPLLRLGVGVSLPLHAGLL